MSLPAWTRLSSRPLADCKVFQLRADTYRSPRTGEPVEVDEKRAPFFRTGKELRERLNGNGKA